MRIREVSISLMIIVILYGLVLSVALIQGSRVEKPPFSMDIPVVSGSRTLEVHLPQFEEELTVEI